MENILKIYKIKCRNNGIQRILLRKYMSLLLICEINENFAIYICSMQTISL